MLLRVNSNEYNIVRFTNTISNTENFASITSKDCTIDIGELANDLKTGEFTIISGDDERTFTGFNFLDVREEWDSDVIYITASLNKPLE